MYSKLRQGIHDCCTLCTHTAMQSIESTVRVHTPPQLFSKPPILSTYPRTSIRSRNKVEIIYNAASTLVMSASTSALSETYTLVPVYTYLNHPTPKNTNAVHQPFNLSPNPITQPLIHQPPTQSLTNPSTHHPLSLPHIHQPPTQPPQPIPSTSLSLSLIHPSTHTPTHPSSARTA